MRINIAYVSRAMKYAKRFKYNVRLLLKFHLETLKHIS